MSKDCLLAIDNGTQSVRALVFDPQGNLLARSRIVIEPYFSTAPGLAEQHPEVFWKAICTACQKLWQEAPAFKERIAGVALTTQRATMINVDHLGRPLRPAIIWLDQRRTPGLKPVSGLWGLAFFLTGMRQTAAYLQAEAEANWIRTYQPEILKAAGRKSSKSFIGDKDHVTMIHFPAGLQSLNEMENLVDEFPFSRIGVPSWFFNGLSSIKHYFDHYVDNFGWYRIAGLNNITGSILTLPSQHDIWRRTSANWLAGLVVNGLVDLENAYEIIYALAYSQVKSTYRI